MTIRRNVNDDYSIASRDRLERIILTITKPSYTLALGFESLRVQNRSRLRRLLRKLVRQHNWKEASGVLSVLLKGTGKDRSPAKNRTKYWVTMELLKHINGECINPTKILRIYEIWMKKIGLSKKWSIKDRFMVRLEFILFCLTQGNVEDAHQAVICLMQEREFGSDPISNMVVGLTFYQLWYSAIPKEMQLKDLDESFTPLHSEMSGTIFNTPKNSVGHDAVDIHEADSSIKEKDIHGADSPFHCDSYTSIMLEKDNALDQSFKRQGFYMNTVKESGQEKSSFSNHGDDMPHASIFYAHGLDSWLLPLRLLRTSENLEAFTYLHKEKLNDYYKNAVKYLRLALYSTPPLFEAVLPLIQMLLLGDQVKEALNELEKFVCNSDTTLPLRLKASLLEQFNSKNYVKISACFEDILKKDPTCSHSLARLVSLHQNGDYSTEQLLEMIALHLDATYAECNTWKEFAACFLKLSECEEDRMSMCLDGNEDGPKQSYSIRFNRIPKNLTDGILGKSWRFRCKWWLTRHFSRSILNSEFAAGDLQLLTYKAASASHLYGIESEYVAKVYACLENKNKDLLLFLQMHMQNSVGLCKNFDKNL
ncbi:hypothetical protein F0562_010374 [Nyssa sinensis]|uniref:Uncharacterized protein n=1 Tax=Nyssa sinensis TaxID=561372 RepID=A0A5J5A3G4_9ASTE|nr:hypothetical protein F0562_010374 [Nyssa sinensis]